MFGLSRTSDKEQKTQTIDDPCHPDYVGGEDCQPAAPAPGEAPPAPAGDPVPANPPAAPPGAS